MTPLMSVGLAMASLTGAVVAWKYATANLYRRAGAKWSTDSIDPERINRRLLARRKRQRIQMVAMSALITPILVYAFIFFVEALIEGNRPR